MISIKIQEKIFDPESIYRSIAKNRTDIGAKLMFTGMVKDFFESEKVRSLYIEHYPSMADRQLKKICEGALDRWEIDEIHLVHRYGLLQPGENIVNLVLVAKGRGAVFEGGRFIMDYLKSDAPFWKKEYKKDGWSWVEQNSNDIKNMKLW